MNGTNPSANILNTTDATFERDVLQRSHDVPVVVDFWATWCQPCRMLGPVLEKLADEYAGQFLLVKADTEQTGSAATQFGVSSIPAVFGVIGGEIADGFVGALPERQLRNWLDRLIESAARAKTLRLIDTAPEQAETELRKWADAAPNDSTPKIGLARVLLSLGRTDECREIIEGLAKRGFLEPEAEIVKAKLDLGSIEVGGLDEARREAEQHPDDLTRQLRLGEALAASQKYEEALECLLAIVQKDKRSVGESARQVILDIFRVLPQDSPLVSTYRRKLSTALY